MDGSAQEDAAARAREARELQRGWYGEPLGELFQRLIEGLGLNQARLAGVLGLSAPMLSQLKSGQRAKIGNPAVVQRLQALQELAWEVADGRTGAAQAGARMEEIRESAGSSVLGPTSRSTGVEIAPRQVVRAVQELLGSLAAPADIERAARALAPEHPHLAEFLRVYGTGRSADALAHYEAHRR